MFYQTLKVLMTLAFRIYFRKIELLGIENMPKNGPVLLACNHPSSFMEGCLLACFQDRELHFLVRGDVFNIKWLRPLLIHTNQIPIFRFKDGFSKLKENKSTFSATYEVLARGGSVIIYPEGSTIMVKQLRPLQKGLAKISMGALDEYPRIPLKIVPVGINYSNVTRFRSDVSVSVGQAIDVRSHYVDDTDTVKRREAISELTNHVYEAMKPHVVSVDHPKIEGINQLLRTAYLSPEFTNSDSHLAAEMNMAQSINTTSEAFLEKTLTAVNELELHDRFDFGINKKRDGWLEWTLLALLSPFAIAGYLLNSLPFYLARWISRNKMKDIEFVAPVRLASWLILFLVYLTIILVFLLFASGIKALLYVLAIPILGLISIWWWERYSQLWVRSKFSELLDRLKFLTNEILQKSA